MSRRKRQPEPACSRCGNEADLRQWFDGKVYCPSCLDCGCDDGFQKTNHTCVKCLRDLYTVITFEGPRLCDPEIYVLDAWTDYGVRAYELMTWTFEEEEIVESLFDPAHTVSVMRNGIETPQPRKPPPHHRFTSWGGSR